MQHSYGGEIISKEELGTGLCDQIKTIATHSHSFIPSSFGGGYEWNALKDRCKVLETRRKSSK